MFSEIDSFFRAPTHTDIRKMSLNPNMKLSEAFLSVSLAINHQLLFETRIRVLSVSVTTCMDPTLSWNSKWWAASLVRSNLLWMQYAMSPSSLRKRFPPDGSLLLYYGASLALMFRMRAVLWLMYSSNWTNEKVGVAFFLVQSYLWILQAGQLLSRSARVMPWVLNLNIYVRRFPQRISSESFGRKMPS